jgi:mannosylfructose-phosphate synthase
VLALGRVAANKGYDLLIRALTTVRDRIPDVSLVLAVGSTSPTPGETRQIEELRTLVEDLDLGRHVEFRDYIPDEQLADVYRAADVFALSSRYEPIGMTAIEAMACGTPSVITDQGGLYQLLTWGRETLYVDPTDPPAFGHAIATVLHYPDVAQTLSLAASAKMRDDFTWGGVARRLQAIVQRLSTMPVSRREAGTPAGAAKIDPRDRVLKWVSAGSS